MHWALDYGLQESLPLTMRGGGSGLAGQTVGRGIVADTSRWMTRILSVDPASRVAVVQPGVVLADLNRVLSPHGLWFAPDPSSQDFCTLGGMLANNSKGAHSVKYGPTVRHVRWLRMLLPDGTEMRLEEGFRAPEEYSHPALRRIALLLLENRRSIEEGWPRSRTNSSGYNLRDCLCPGGEIPSPQEKVNLLPLFIGSEGTLAVILEAGLHLTPVPGHRALTMLEFANPAEAAASVVGLLPGGPSACEILDGTFLDIIRAGLGVFPIPIRDEVGTVLLVESDGESRDEAEERMDDLLRRASAGSPMGIRRAASAEERQAIWSFRKAASPLLNKGRGERKAVRFIEDGAVPTEAIPNYIEEVHRILSERDIKTVIFGHAGDGNLHVNPFMDLLDRAHHQEVPSIAREVAELLKDLQGSLSGEHGDGRLRTPYLEIIYGDLVHLFREIKLAMDPHEILNPGIIAPAHAEPMEKGIRFTPDYRRSELPGALGQVSWAFEAERCHGCGTCRDFCPTAMATDHDLLSSRGRSHILQALLAGEIEPDAAGRPEIRALFETCLGCSQCARHCPTGVDVAPLAAAFRAEFTPKLRRIRDAWLGEIPSLGYRLGPLSRSVMNIVGGSPVGRLLGRSLLGVRMDLKPPRMAEMPAFDPGRLYRFTGRGRGKVLFFYGCYGNIYNPTGEAGLAVQILRAFGVEVVVPPQACCGISKLSRGLPDAVVEDAAFNWKQFGDYIEQGFVVLASAPSCLLALKREHPRIFTDGPAQRLAHACLGIFPYLRLLFEAMTEGERERLLNPVPMRVLYQTPCHGAAAETWMDETAILGMIPELDLVDVTSECCGMAGSFGAEARHAELSDAIAAPLMTRIRRASPERIVTPCGSCKSRLERDLSIPVVHPLALLAESMGIEPPRGAARAGTGDRGQEGK